MTPEALRALVPATSTHVWLNAAASSPLSTPVADAVTQQVAETVAQGDLSFPRWLASKEQLRARVARFVGALPTEVAFTPSTSFGFSIIGALLKRRGIEEVLTLGTEFPSTTQPLLHAGLTLQVVRPRPDGSYPLEDLEAALTPKTKAIAVSVVQYASGFRVDLQGVAALAKAKGLALCLNAAQALGQVPVDVHALDADFLAAPSHKWLMAGFGQGVLVIRERWLHDAPVPLGGWLSVPAQQLWQPFAGATTTEGAHGFSAHGTAFRHDASALEGGGGNWASLAALDAALALHEAVGVAQTLAHNLRLQARLRRGLRARGFVPNAPDDAATGSGICVVPVQGDVLETVRRLIREAKVVTTPRGGGLRISTHVFNDEADVDALLEAVDRLEVKP
jgi:selenocysteine lyase/cysteine desulfurase